MTIPCPGEVELGFRTTLVITTSPNGVCATIVDLSLIDGLPYNFGPVCRSTKEVAVLDLIVFLRESGEELSPDSAHELLRVGKYALERACDAIGGKP